jgi:hypothetical protein
MVFLKQYSITPIIRINWHHDPSGYAENLNFLWKETTWQFKVQKISKNGFFRLHIYSRTNKTAVHSSLYIFDNWGGGEI